MWALITMIRSAQFLRGETYSSLLHEQEAEQRRELGSGHQNPLPPPSSVSLDRRYHLTQSLLLGPSILCAECGEPAGPAKLRTGTLGAKAGRLTWRHSSTAIGISSHFLFQSPSSLHNEEATFCQCWLPFRLFLLFKNFGEENYHELSRDLVIRSVWRSWAVKVASVF